MEGLLISILWIVAIAAIVLGIVYFALGLFGVTGQAYKLILGGVGLLFLVWILAVLLGASPGPRFGALGGPPAGAVVSGAASPSPGAVGA